MKTALIEVVQILYDNDCFLTFTELAEYSCYSKRYLAKLIREEEKEFTQYGFQIIQEFRKGYRLVVKDQEKFAQLENIKNEDQLRQKEVLLLLLDRDKPIRIQDLADHFYVSQSTMSRLLKDVREICEEHHLTLQTEHKKGIFINGNELHKLILRVHLDDGRETISEENVIIQNILYEVLNDYNYSISDMGFNNLVYHLIVMIQRIQNNQVIMDKIELNNEYAIQKEITDEICARLEEQFTVQISDNERIFVTLHLLGKQIVSENHEVNPVVFDLVDKILERVYQAKQVDLRNNMELRISLCLHIQPLLFRLEYNFSQENPMIEQIKREMAESYDIALIAKEVIYDRYKLLLDDQETGYLAMHFSLALSKDIKSTNQLKILIVCATGRATAKILQHKLMEEYRIAQEHLPLTSLVQLNNMDVSSYDCIISSISIPFRVDIPVIRISPLIDDESMGKIDNFFKKASYIKDNSSHLLREDMVYAGADLKTKEEVVQFISTECMEKFACNEDIYSEIMKREELSSTEIGNMCCMPHTLDYYPTEPIIMVIVLKKPIQWEKGRVKYVFFNALPQQDERISYVVERITEIVSDREKLIEIENNPTIQQINL